MPVGWIFCFGLESCSISHLKECRLLDKTTVSLSSWREIFQINIVPFLSYLPVRLEMA